MLMSKQQTELKVDPFYIDVNLVSSLGVQKQLTDYIDLLTTFADETVLNHDYWHTEHHSDPMTSKIDFYKNINNNTYKIKESPTGVMTEKTTEEKLHNKAVRDQLPDDVFLKTDSGQFGQPVISGKTTKAVKNVTTKTWGSEGEDTPIGSWSIIKDEPVEQQIDVLDRTDIQREPTELKEDFGMEEMSPWFVLWWMEKFKTSHRVVQSGLRELLGDENEYFVNFSESVGQLKNIDDTYDTSTIPLYAIDSGEGSGFPVASTIPGVAKYCVKPETMTMSAQLAHDSDNIYKINMFNHADDSSRDVVVNKLAELPVNSHGCNLVIDAEHPKRITRFIETIREEIKNHLKGLYDVLELLSNRENYMITGKPRQILLKVEKFTQAVDLFKNKIKSNELDRDDMTISRYGKGTYYNNRQSTIDYLG